MAAAHEEERGVGGDEECDEEAGDEEGGDEKARDEEARDEEERCAEESGQARKAACLTIAIG